MYQLHLFTQQLCRIPFLRTDPALHAFIAIQSDKDFKLIMEQGFERSPIYESSKWKNESLEEWFVLIDAINLDKSIDTHRTMGDFHRQLEAIRIGLDSLDRECRATGRKAMLLSQSMNALTETVFNWQKIEYDLLDPNKNEYQNPHGIKIKNLLSQLVAGQSYWSTSINVSFYYFLLFFTIFLLLFTNFIIMIIIMISLYLK
jgi:hypothetical protein